MKPDLLEILRCPVCRGELTLTSQQAQGDDVLRGTLVCARCKVDYPIADGIPDLLPPNERD
ncbi:MAG: methytransferase partner Trm112 [Thermoplasmata archaeon]